MTDTMAMVQHEARGAKRNDLRRLAASVGLLGTELEMKAEEVWDRLTGWEQGPVSTPKPGIVGGGGTEQDAADRRAERAQARRAGEQLAEYRADLAALDALVQKLNRTLDMACPPDVSALRNRRTGEFEPETATDMLADGWCPNCWTNGLGSVPLAPLEGKSQVRRYSDRCRPCGDFRRAEGIDKPKAIAVAHAEGRRMSVDDVAKIVKAAKAAANPKKNRKGKKGRKAA